MFHRIAVSIRILALLALGGTPSHAQALPGGSVLAGCMGLLPTGPFSAQLHSPGNRVLSVDLTSGTSTPLVMAPWSGTSGEIPTSLVLETPTQFLMGTTTLSSSATVLNGNLHRATWNGTSWSTVQLNTNPLTGNGVTNLVVFGAEIWFTTTLYWSNGSTPGCRVWSMPLAGGTATLRFDLSALGAPGIWGALAVHGSEIHVFTFRSNGPSEQWKIDMSMPTPATTLVGPLPPTLRTGAGAGFGALTARWDPWMQSFLVAGVFGDLLWRDAAGNNVLRRVDPTPYGWTWTHEWSGMTINTDTGAILCGDKAAHIEELHSVNGAMLLDRTTLPVAAGTSAMVIGLSYVPHSTGAGYHPTGIAGCPHGNGTGPATWPVNYCNSLPSAGNPAFASILESPATLAWFAIGSNSTTWGGIPLPFDLGLIGGPAGCLLGTSGDIATLPMLVVAGIRQSPSFPLPPAPFTADLTTQWAVADPGNALGLVLSDVRLLRIR